MILIFMERDKNINGHGVPVLCRQRISKNKKLRHLKNCHNVRVLKNTDDFGIQKTTEPPKPKKPKNPTKQQVRKRFLAQKREELWVRYMGRCQYCGVITVPPEKVYDPKDNPPDDMATIDHVYSRLNPLRGLDLQEYKLACYKCNQERGWKDLERWGTKIKEDTV